MIPHFFGHPASQTFTLYSLKLIDVHIMSIKRRLNGWMVDERNEDWGWCSADRFGLALRKPFSFLFSPFILQEIFALMLELLLCVNLATSYDDFMSSSCLIFASSFRFRSPSLEIMNKKYYMCIHIIKLFIRLFQLIMLFIKMNWIVLVMVNVWYWTVRTPNIPFRTVDGCSCKALKS